MVESESFLDSTRRVVESWVFAKRGIVRGRRKGALPCASRAIKADAHASAVLHAARGDFDHVDLVAELQNDLLDDARCAEDVDLHAGDSAVLRGPDVERLDVVAATRYEPDDSCEDAWLVLDIAVETVDFLFHASASFSTTTSTSIGDLDLTALAIAASSLLPSVTRTPRIP